MDAKKATTTIPIVMANSVDPVGDGLVGKSGASGRQCHRDFGFVTRTNYENARDTRTPSRSSPELDFCGRGRNSPQLKVLRPAAVALKLKLEEIETQIDAKGIESAFKIAKQKQVGAIMVNHSRQFVAERKRIVELASKYRLPAINYRGSLSMRAV